MELPQDTIENPRGFGGTPDPEPVTNAEGEIPATEEEQLDYDLLTVRARKMIFGPGKEKILKMLGTSQSPAQGIGKAGSMIIKSLMDSSKEQGREIDPEVALNAAPEVIDDLNELAKVNKVFQYDSPEDEQKELQDAMLWGTKYYGDGMVANGEITPDMKNLAKRQVQEGIAGEQNKGPKKKPIAAGVGQAMAAPAQAPPTGLVGANMGGGY
jgi:hypothetical protein